MAAPRQYRIEVQGRLPEGVVSELPAMAVTADGGRTRMSGPVADVAALYGLIARLEALGLTLLSLHSIEKENEDAVEAE